MKKTKYYRYTIPFSSFRLYFSLIETVKNRVSFLTITGLAFSFMLPSAPFPPFHFTNVSPPLKQYPQHHGSFLVTPFA